MVGRRAGIRLASLIIAVLVALSFLPSFALVAPATYALPNAAAAQEVSSLDQIILSTVDSGAESTGDISSLGYTVADLEAVLTTLVDMPSAGSIVESYTWRFRGDDDASALLCEVMPVYYVDAAALPTFVGELGEGMARAAAWAPAADDDLGKTQAIHDYLVRNVTYVTNGQYASSAYGALVEGKANSRGFAKAYALVLGSLGVECRYMDDCNGISWNLVKVDGEWYHVCVSMDADSDYTRQGFASHDYFLVGTDFLEYGGLTFDGRQDASGDDYPFQGTWAVYDAPGGVPSQPAVDMGRTGMSAPEFLVSLIGDAMRSGLTSVGDLRCLHLDQAGIDEATRLLYDDPVLTYFVGGSSYNYKYRRSNDADRIVMNVEVNLRELDAAQTAQQIAAIDYVIDCIVQSVPAEYGPVMQAAYVHDWLVSYVVYGDASLSEGDPGYSRQHAAVGCLLDYCAVCAGYAGAYQAILDRLGIPCITVSSGLMAHSWNMVQIDGTWYHVDVTWDDPVPDQGQAYMNREYFLLSDAQIMEKGHYGWDSPYQAPQFFPW